jgi:hypothetical protein
MTDTPLSLNMTIYMLTTITLAGGGLFFTLVSLAGTIRRGGKEKLHYFLLSLSVTLYALTLWLPTTGRITVLTSFHWLIAANILFYLVIFLYLLFYNYSMGSMAHGRTVGILAIIFTYLILFFLLSQLIKGNSTFLVIIRKLNWGSLTIAVAALFVIIRLVMAYCYHEKGKVGGTVSLLVFLIPTLIPIIISGSIRGIHVKTFTVYTLPLLMLWEFGRIFTSPSFKAQKSPAPDGVLREQFSQSQSEKKDLTTLLADREEELGQYFIKAGKVSHGLLPSTIHHDGMWEVATFFSPLKGGEKRDFFDFYYSYGRKVSGVSLFETPRGLDGALFTSLLKKEWDEGFNSTSSLASLFRRINIHLNEIFGTGDLKGSVIKLDQEKIEYTGFSNAPLYYINGKLNKSAPLIQDKAASVNDIKSYSLPCQQGDAFLICNNRFLNKPASVTGISFEKAKLTDVLENFQGRSSDMVTELINARNKHMGKKDEEGILLIYLKRRS